MNIWYVIGYIIGLFIVYLVIAIESGISIKRFNRDIKKLVIEDFKRNRRIKKLIRQRNKEQK